MLNLQTHQRLIDEAGNTTNVLVPYEDYQQLIALLKQEEFKAEMKRSLHRSLQEIKEAEAGGEPLQSLESLLNEVD